MKVEPFFPPPPPGFGIRRARARAHRTGTELTSRDLSSRVRRPPFYLPPSSLTSLHGGRERVGGKLVDFGGGKTAAMPIRDPTIRFYDDAGADSRTRA